MKRIGIPALMLVAGIAAGCQRTDRADRATPADNAAVGTSGSSDVSRADKDGKVTHLPTAEPAKAEAK